MPPIAPLSLSTTVSAVTSLDSILGSSMIVAFPTSIVESLRALDPSVFVATGGVLAVRLERPKIAAYCAEEVVVSTDDAGAVVVGVGVLLGVRIGIIINRF